LYAVLTKPKGRMKTCVPGMSAEHWFHLIEAQGGKWLAAARGEGFARTVGMSLCGDQFLAVHECNVPALLGDLLFLGTFVSDLKGVCVAVPDILVPAGYSLKFFSSSSVSLGGVEAWLDSMYPNAQCEER
jgi:hypothetical protein